MRPAGRRSMRSAVRVIGLSLVLAASLSAAARAESPTITVDPAPCVPKEDNGVFNGRVAPEVGGSTVRLYFRWRDHGTFYYVEMNPAGGGRYWGGPPKPEKTTQQVERYVTVVDAEGRELGRSASAQVPVTDDCKVDLTPKQEGQANNLVVGETALPQKGRDVLGFLCDGIVSRVDANGILRVDDNCRACVVAGWQQKEVLAVPLIGATAVVLCRNGVGCHPHEPEPSPSRP